MLHGAMLRYNALSNLIFQYLGIQFILCDTGRCAIIWYGVALYGMMLYDMALCHNMIQHRMLPGVVLWYDMWH